jgi:hypothetical protein
MARKDVLNYTNFELKLNIKMLECREIWSILESFWWFHLENPFLLN